MKYRIFDLVQELRIVIFIVLAHPTLFCWKFICFHIFILILDWNEIRNSVKYFLCFLCFILFFIILEDLYLLKKLNNCFIHFQQCFSAFIHKYINVLLWNRLALIWMITMIVKYALFADHLVVFSTIISYLNLGMIFTKDRTLN